MEKLWGGRFGEGAAELLDRFNASLPFDQKLYREDIEGSIAHSTMLAKQGIIADSEKEQIVSGLSQIMDEIEQGKFVFDIAHEDIHMAIETRLIQMIGDVGKKLHTARSRNDQVAVDFRRYVLKADERIAGLCVGLIESLLQVAEKHTQTLLPGMTHLQHAQPVSFAFHLLAYASMLTRDVDRFKSAQNRNNVCPLGSAAMAGTPYPTDRHFSAELLGFKEPTVNAMDSVSDRDFACEILFHISMLMMHLSRLAEEMILWSSYEFKFITISDAYATGSSIMPQKKNPDVPELIRGKTGRVYGNLMGLLTVMKGLPLAYNKDTQEDKEGVFDSVETAEISLTILIEVIKTMTVNVENMEEACKKGHLTATDLADYLVQKCDIPFREAHHITGKCVARAEKEGVDLSEMEIDSLQSVDSRIQEDVLPCLSLRNSMESRNSYGGTASGQVEKQLAHFANWLKEQQHGRGAGA